MSPIVFSGSRSYQQFLSRHLDVQLEVFDQPRAPGDVSDQVHLIHISSLASKGYQWLEQHALGQSINVAVCSDLPDVQEMLECVRLGARGYCNSYMAPLHFRQMLEMLANGQSWFPPGLLEETFKLAQQAVRTPEDYHPTNALTPRENEIARCVAEGMSNRNIADLLGISEPTVKTHLSRVFRKLELKDRVGLVLHLKRA
jgi:two-component system nitrate/nitrite response regulator NarL